MRIMHGSDEIFSFTKLRDKAQNHDQRARRLPLPPKARQDKGRPSV